jgi:glycosyltransferase involved in cell wall biosynthesis
VRRVLFIAYYFPPINRSGVYRSAKFVKYLPLNGWQPYVISTSDPADTQEFDPGMLADIPSETSVWRVPTPQPHPYSALARRLRPSATQRAGSGAAVTGQAGAGEAQPMRNLALRSLLRKLAWPLWLIEQPPVDAQLYWAGRIIPLAWQIIRQQQVEVIYTSSAPFSALMSGLVLKRLTGRPWVMDMRDPWVSNEYMYRKTGLRRRMDVGLERAALKAADKVVIVSSAFADELLDLSAGRAADKLVVITNGFDEEDFVAPPAGDPLLPERRLIIHMGTLVWDRFKVLLPALERLESDTFGGVLDRFQVVCYGWSEPCIPIEARLVSSSASLSIRPMVGHQRAVSLMQRADVLLLLLGSEQYWSRFHTGKIFEYLRAGRPVLGVGPLGAASRLIERCGVGCFVAAEDTERLAAVLRQIALDYPGFCAQYYHPRAETIAQYDRRVLAEHLATAFNSVAAK